MGLAALDSKPAPVNSAEQHAEFLTKWNLSEVGDPNTATRRSRVVSEALAEQPEILSPELNQREKQVLVQLLYEEADCFTTSMEDLREPADAPPL